MGLIGTDVAFLPLRRHTLLPFTLHRKEIIHPVGVPENHIAGLNGHRSLNEKHKGPKNLSKARQDMRVYSPNPPISEVEGGSFISLDWLSVIHLVREKRRSRINSSGALCKETQRLMQDQFNKTRTVPCHRHVTAASWTAPYQVHCAGELPGCTPTKTANLQLPDHTSSGLHVSQAAQFSKVTFKVSSQNIPPHHRLPQTLLKEASVGYHTRGALPVGGCHVRLDVPYMVRGLELASTPALSVGVALRPPPYFSTVTAT